MITIDQLPNYESEIIQLEYEGCINVKKPEQYSEFPEIKSIPKDHFRYTMEERIDFFDELNNWRLRVINDYEMSEDDFDVEMICDNCEKDIETDSYYICSDCGIDLCHECKSSRCLDHKVRINKS